MDCFYSISMKHDDALRDAFLLSEKTIVEIKDDNYRRVPNAGRSAPELLDELLSDEKNHLVFILRRDMEHVDGIKIPYWECGGCTMGKKNDEFLYMYLSYENGWRIVQHYGLKQM